MGRRNAGDRRRLDTGVAIATVEPEATDVMRMIERHRLIDRYRLISGVFRSRHSIREADRQKRHRYNRNENTTRDRIRTGFEQVRHTLFS